MLVIQGKAFSAAARSFVEKDRSGNPKRLQWLEPKFREVIETGRANAVAVPKSESQSVLATLKSITPRPASCSGGKELGADASDLRESETKP